MRILVKNDKGGFHLHILVFPFVYQLIFRIGVLVHLSFANNQCRRISTTFQHHFKVDKKKTPKSNKQFYYTTSSSRLFRHKMKKDSCSAFIDKSAHFWKWIQLPKSIEVIRQHGVLTLAQLCCIVTFSKLMMYNFGCCKEIRNDQNVTVFCRD